MRFVDEGFWPFFYWMDKQKVIEALEGHLSQSDLFLVDVQLDASNNLRVFADKPSGITIEECKQISRFIVSEFDREVEDYALQVSSPDLSKPFKVHAQYQKNIGREIQVKTEDEKLKGELLEVLEDQIKLSYTEVLREKKKKIKVQKELAIPFESIVEAKTVISFKKR